MTITANYPAIRPSLLLDFANEKALDSRITFTRSTTGTYYNGVTSAVAEQNLFLQSNTFSNGYWQSYGIGTPVVGATDPAGGTTAYTLTATATTLPHLLQQFNYVTLVANTTYTLSCYLQAGNTYNYAALGFRSGSSDFITTVFTLTGAGTAGTPSVLGTITSTSTPTITQVGSTAWYRCTIQFTSSVAVTSGTPSFQLSNTATPTLGSGTNGFITWTAAGTETLLVYGAQLEQRTAVTAYNATTTTAITNYIPVLQTGAINQARFDHNPTTGESLGLLIEQQSTNLFTYSSDYKNAAWTIQNSTVTATADISPDGTQNAQMLVEGTSASVPYRFYLAFTYTATSYTQSIYAKANGRNYIVLWNSSGASVAQCTFDLSAGTVVTPSNCTAAISSVGNGWYRCSITFTALAGAANTMFQVQNNSTNGYNSYYTGNGYSGIYVWGAQLEALAFPTSYIPTVASQVTRSADSASMTGTNFSSWYNNAEGTIYEEINPLALATASGVTINDNTTSNRIRVTTNSTTDQSLITTLGTAQATLDGGTPVASTAMKLATAYKTNDFALSLNGGTVATDTSGSIPIVTQLQIGAETTTIGTLTLKKVAYYPIRVTNAQLQALTG